MSWGRKSPEERDKVFQRIEMAKIDCWRNIHLFDSRKSMEKSDEYVIEVRGEKVSLFEGGYQDWFRKDNRLFGAIFLWKQYPALLRDEVDQYWPDYPDFDCDYRGLEDAYRFAQERAVEYLMGVAEAERFDGAAISTAGLLCRQMVETADRRQALWGDDCVLGDWPDCHPDLLGLPPDIRQSLVKGYAQVECLSRLVECWRAPVEEPDLLPVPAPQNALPVATRLPEDIVTIPIASHIDPTAEPEFVFRPDGDGYFLKGFGESGHVTAKGAIGLHDLFRLVQKPGVPVRMLELDAGPGTNPAKGDEQSRQPVADGQTFEQIAAKRNELKAEIEAAESDMERSELDAELVKLEESAKGMTGLNGKSRDINNPLDKLRPKLLKRIATACKKLRKASFNKLADHFGLAVSSESGCLVYRPAVEGLTWSVTKL